MAKKSSRPSTPVQAALKRERVGQKRRNARNPKERVDERGFSKARKTGEVNRIIKGKRQAEKDIAENKLEEVTAANPKGAMTPDELKAIERAGTRGRSTVTGRSAREQAMADMKASGFGQKTADEELEAADFEKTKGERMVKVKRDSSGQRVGTVETSTPKRRHFEAYASNRTMSPADTADFLNDVKEFHGSRGDRREKARVKIHTALRSKGSPRVRESVRIPCAVPGCHSRDVTVHPSVGDKKEWAGVKNAPEVYDVMFGNTVGYRCAGHEAKPDVKDLWDMAGEAETKKNREAKAKKEEKKIVATGTRSTAKVE